tara:strand:- start:202 stop:1365 length:1164 start_codon:yes stop_codon:yes gene_type:complete
MNFLFKFKNALKEKRLIRTLKKKIYPYLKGFSYLLSFKKSQIEIIVSRETTIDKSDLPLAKRIFNSFKLMKSEQDHKSALYKPSSLWQSQINESYSFLLESYKNNDVEKFLYFLQNFGNWNKFLGVESQGLIKKYNKNSLLKNFLKYEIFEGQLNLWKYFNKEKNLKEVELPKYGNQVGALVENNFVVIGSFSNHIYADILINYLDQNSTIMELGGGYGKFAYYILKKRKNFTYIDFDIPETLTLASYFLSKCFPNKKNFFYGEAEFDKNIEINHDLIFLPSWEIEKMNDNTVNLALNKNSLGEMDPLAAKNYLKHIHRTSKYFFSMNHEYFRNHFSDGNKSLINKEYNLDGKFKELIRYSDLGHLIYENNKIDYDNNIFFYIFKKK